jgi:hypothetical protein
MPLDDTINYTIINLWIYLYFEDVPLTLLTRQLMSFLNIIF